MPNTRPFDSNVNRRKATSSRSSDAALTIRFESAQPVFGGRQLGNFENTPSSSSSIANSKSEGSSVGQLKEHESSSPPSSKRPRLSIRYPNVTAMLKLLHEQKPDHNALSYETALHDVGLRYLDEFSMWSPASLAEVTDIPPGTAKVIVDFGLKLLSDWPLLAVREREAMLSGAKQEERGEVKIEAQEEVMVKMEDGNDFIASGVGTTSDPIVVD